jgi:hypothetical protein
MKKLLLSLVLLLGVHAGAQAQTEKGNLLVGGSGFAAGTPNFEGRDRYMELEASMSPRVGYFVADQLCLGALVPLQYTRQSSYTLRRRWLGAGVNPFIRSYVGSSATRLVLEARGGINYRSWYGLSVSQDYQSDSGFYVNGGLGTGLVHFINNRIGLELLLSYDWMEGKAIRPAAMHNGLGVNLGIQAYFNKRK